MGIHPQNQTLLFLTLSDCQNDRKKKQYIKMGPLPFSKKKTKNKNQLWSGFFEVIYLKGVTTLNFL